MPSDQEPLFLVPMERTHLAAVTEIEHRSFLSPWSPWLFSAFLDNPSGRVFVLLQTSAEEKASVLGYLCLSLSDHCAHILKLAVHPSYRRRGNAWKLLHYATAYASSQGALRASLEVREGNRAAQELYRTFGFVRTGVRPHYYEDTNEHALVYCLDLSTSFWKGRPRDLMEAAL